MLFSFAVIHHHACRLEKLLKVRETLNEGLPEEEKLSLNDMLLKAAAIASEKVPDVSRVEYACTAARATYAI